MAGMHNWGPSLDTIVRTALVAHCASLRRLWFNVDGKSIDKYHVLFSNNRAHMRQLVLDVRGD